MIIEYCQKAIESPEYKKLMDRGLLTFRDLTVSGQTAIVQKAQETRVQGSLLGLATSIYDQGSA